MDSAPNPASATPVRSGLAHPPLPRNVKLLGAASLLNDIASEMIYPLLPDLLRSLLAGSALHLGVVLGVIEGAADATASLLKLFAGDWSDRIGRRRTWIISGYWFATLSRPLLGLVTGPWQMLACRVGDRFGKGIRTSARDAMLAESTGPASRGWAFGFHRGMDHLGAAIGPLVALLFLWLWPEQLRLMFVLTIVPGLAVMALLIFGLRETGPRLKKPPAEHFILSLAPLDGNFRVYLLSLAIFTLGNSSDLFLLAQAGALGATSATKVSLWFAFHVVKSAGNMLAGRAVPRLGTRPMIFAGWTVYAAVYVGFALSSQLWHVWALFMAYAVFYALTEPSEKTLVAQLTSGVGRGLAYGWYNFAIGIMLLPASLLFGWLYDAFGALAAFGTGAGLALVAAVLLVFVRIPPRSSDED
jgi:MFS family permease